MTGTGTPLIGRMLLFDALGMTFRSLRLRKNPECKVCGPNPTVHELIDYEEFCNPVTEFEITAKELAERIERGDDLVLVDVREPYEHEAGHLLNDIHIPLQQVPAQIEKIPADKEVVLYCRSGGGSARAQQFLMSNGYRRVKNLVGGMQGWKRDVDPGMNVL